MTPAEAAASRPRVDGDRESEILQAALDTLIEVGFDRLTMDAVAARAKASKATLYRRWSGKVQLVIDALHQTKGHDEHELADIDTGSLRGDLQASYCGLGGLDDPSMIATMSAVATAVARDPEFAVAFRRDIIGPKLEATKPIWQRARERGEVRADLDLSLIEPALAGVVLHRVFVLGETPDQDLITRVIDQIILPCVGASPSTPTAPAASGETAESSTSKESQ